MLWIEKCAFFGVKKHVSFHAHEIQRLVESGGGGLVD